MIKKINLTIANCYLVKSDKVVLVDTGAPNSAQKILKAAKKSGIAANDIDLILLTHAHSDHAGSAGELRKLTGAPVAVHKDDVEMLQRGNNGAMIPVGTEARFSQPFVDRPFPAIDPDIVISSPEDLNEFNLPAKLLHTPGHSAGSISLVFKTGNAIVGDIMRGGIMGGTFLAQRPNYPYFLYDKADKAILHQSVQKVLDAGAAQFFVGHGGALPRHAVKRWLAAQIADFQPAESHI